MAFPQEVAFLREGAFPQEAAFPQEEDQAVVDHPGTLRHRSNHQLLHESSLLLEVDSHHTDFPAGEAQAEAQAEDSIPCDRFVSRHSTSAD